MDRAILHCINRLFVGALDFKLAAPLSMTSWNSPPFLTPPVDYIWCKEFLCRLHAYGTLMAGCVCLCVCACVCVCVCVRACMLHFSNNGLWNTYTDWDGWLSLLACNWAWSGVHARTGNKENEFMYICMHVYYVVSAV